MVSFRVFFLFFSIGIFFIFFRFKFFLSFFSKLEWIFLHFIGSLLIFFSFNFFLFWFLLLRANEVWILFQFCSLWNFFPFDFFSYSFFLPNFRFLCLFSSFNLYVLLLQINLSYNFTAHNIISLWILGINFQSILFDPLSIPPTVLLSHRPSIFLYLQFHLSPANPCCAPEFEYSSK